MKKALIAGIAGVVLLALGAGGATALADTDGDTLANAWTKIRSLVASDTAQNTRLSALESKHSIDCTTVTRRLNEGWEFLADYRTDSERLASAIREVEDYLDDATSNAHYQTRWSSTGAVAEIKRCVPGFEELDA